MSTKAWIIRNYCPAKPRRVAGAALVAVGLAVATAAIPVYGSLHAAPTDGVGGGLYEDALSRFHDSDFSGAIIQLKNILQQNPSDLAARILIGRAYLQLGNADFAEKELRRALVEGGDEELLIVPLASATYLLERYDEVIDNFSPEGRSPTVEAGLRIVRGQAYFARLDLEEAEAAFTRAMELRPEEAMSMVGLAQVYLARSEVHAALEMSKRATAAGPENYLAWAVDGKIKRHFNRDQDALESYSKAIELQPDFVEARASRAMILLTLGQQAEVAPDLKVVLEKDPNNPFGSYITALLNLREGNRAGYQTGLQKTDTLLRGLERKLLYSDPEKLLLAGVVNLALENYNDAYNFVRDYVGRNRYHAGARSILGGLLLRRGKNLDALAHLEMAAKLAPNDANILRQLGAAYIANRRDEDAIVTLSRAVTLNPSDTMLHTVLAGSQLRTGRRDEAIAGLEAAIKQDPTATRPGIMLAMIMLRDRDFDSVAEISNRMIERDPKNSTLYNLLGTAQFAKGRIEEARGNLMRAIELDPQNLSAHRNMVQVELGTGEVDAAKARLLSMLEMPGAGTLPLSELADISVREGNLREAISYVAKAREKEPDDIPTQIRLIRLLGQSGDGDAALRNARKLRDKFPESPDVMEQLGRTEFAFGKPEDAAVAYRRMASLLRDSGEKLLMAARYQLTVNDLNGAYETLNRALVTDSDDTALLEMIVDVEARLGRFDDALLRTQQLSERYPENALGERLRGDIFVRQKRYGDAALAYRDGLRKRESGELLVRQYLARRKSGIEFPDLEPLKNWVEKNPKDQVSRMALAAAYLDAENIPAARTLYEALNRDNPNDPVVLNNLAGIYLNDGDDRAMALAEAAHRLAPRQAETLDTLGWVHVRQGDVAEGLEYLRAAYSRESRRSAIRYHLAYALNRLGRRDEARTHLKEVLKAKDLGSLVADVQQLLSEIGD